MALLAIIFIAVLTGALNALRGSGVLKLNEWASFPCYDWKRRAYIWLCLYLPRRKVVVLTAAANALQWAIKRLIVPALFIVPAWYLTHDYLLSAISVLPYFFKIFTGTGGDIQAMRGQICNSANCQEFKPFDIITNWGIELLRKGNWYYNSNMTHCEFWGFIYCSLWAVVYTLPFLATNYLYALPLLLYPLMARYLSWRQTEFFLLTLCNGLYLLSL